MNAFFKQAHIGTGIGAGVLIGDDRELLSSLTLPTGAYLVFAKGDLERFDPDKAIGDAAILFELSGPPSDPVFPASLPKDQTVHHWRAPASHNRGQETILLTIGFSFPLGGTIEKPDEFGMVAFTALAGTRDVFRVSNVSLTALTVDNLF
jgi:hypothetical protein